MFEKVLVAMDLSPATEALVSALPGMKEFGTEALNLVYVTKPMSFPISESLRGVEDVRARLNALANRLRAEGFEVTVDVPSGVPVEEITKMAEKRDPDVILVGSRSRTRIQEAFVGSVAWDVVRQAKRPSLMQRIEANRPDPEAALECRGVGLPRRILHPTDLSETAARAMPWLGDLAKQTSVEISLLHVLDEDEANKRDEALQALEELASQLRGDGAEHVRTEVRFGTPYEEIMSAGAKDTGTLVVMTTQGRGFLPGVILGSQSRQVLRRASARMLLIPAA